MPTLYSFYSTVDKIEERSKIVSGYKDENGQGITEEKNLGWFIHLAGSREALGVGPEKPDLEVGQSIKVMLMPVD